MLDTEVVCIRRRISHIELDSLVPAHDWVLEQMTEIVDSIQPLTEYRTKVSKVTFDGEPYTMIEVMA